MINTPAEKPYKILPRGVRGMVMGSVISSSRMMVTAG